MSADSLHCVTVGTGEAMAEHRDKEVEKVYDLPEPTRFMQPSIPTIEPIETQANISTDGGMVLIRGEGWKEVKLTTVSEVEVKSAQERGRPPALLVDENKTAWCTCIVIAIRSDCGTPMKWDHINTLKGCVGGSTAASN